MCSAIMTMMVDNEMATARYMLDGGAKVNRKHDFFTDCTLGTTCFDHVIRLRVRMCDSAVTGLLNGSCCIRGPRCKLETESEGLAIEVRYGELKHIGGLSSCLVSGRPDT